VSLSRHPACPRQGPAVPVPAPSRICLTLHHASRKLDVLVTELFQFVVFRSGYVAGSIRGWIEEERSRKLYAYVFMRIGVACACACVYCDMVLPRQSLSGATPRGRENDLVHTQYCAVVSVSCWTRWFRDGYGG